MESGKKLDIKNEFLRKLIHVGYSTVPLLYLFTDKTFIVILTGVLSVLMIAIDLLRTRWNWLRDLYMKVLGQILRGHESCGKKSAFTGGTYIVLSSFFCFLLFEKHVAISAMFITTFGDTAAALYGKHFGKIKVYDKTIEGSTVFFIAGLVVLYFMGLLAAPFTLVACMALLITTIMELLPIQVDDNVLIPFSFCVSFNVLSIIFGVGCLC